MKQEQYKLRRLFMIFVLLFAFAAVYQLQARIRLESKEKAIAVVMLQSDVKKLSEASGDPLDIWYQALSDAGLSAVIVPAEQMNVSSVITPIKAAGLEIAQIGGDGETGLYFAPLEYDIQQTQSDAEEAVAPASSNRTWVMVENNTQTGCVLPDGYTIADSDCPWAKGFYLLQNERARTVTMDLNDVQEVGDILFRAVADRGVQVLWIAPLGDEDGMNHQIETYKNILGRLQTRIERCGYHYGIPQGIDALNLSRPILILCGFGVFSAALLLLCLLFSISKRMIWILSVLCVLECVICGLLKPQIQEILLALAASIVFPALSVFDLGNRISAAKDLRHASLLDYYRSVLIGAMITVLGGIYIASVLGSWKYILVLQVFRGVKLSQGTVYLFSVILLGWMLLELRKDSTSKSLLASVDRRLLVRVIGVFVIFVGIGLIYLMRSGDGMLGVSALENRFRAALENLILFRPRTKEFLIAWPCIALAFCFAMRGDRLFSWLFGAMGAIGFASIANTFCHIRAHFLISLARTAIGLFIGLLIGSILFILFRPHKE